MWFKKVLRDFSLKLLLSFLSNYIPSLYLHVAIKSTMFRPIDTGVCVCVCGGGGNCSRIMQQVCVVYGHHNMDMWLADIICCATNLSIINFSLQPREQRASASVLGFAVKGVKT